MVSADDPASFGTIKITGLAGYFSAACATPLKPKKLTIKVPLTTTDNNLFILFLLFLVLFQLHEPPFHICQRK
jgi:hypothetical protein